MERMLAAAAMPMLPDVQVRVQVRRHVCGDLFAGFASTKHCCLAMRLSLFCMLLGLPCCPADAYPVQLTPAQTA